jgi:hypothetical protein
MLIWTNYIALLVLLVFVTAPLNAQDYSRVDAAIQLYPDRFQTPEELSRFISRDFNSDAEKVRAIYGWIINNIAYDPAEYKKFNYNFSNYRERNTKEEQTRRSIIVRTLREGVAVCEGYAMLFERLCELQGIPSYLINGDTKATFSDIGRPFRKNHMWNAVQLDGSYHLFDPTWGAGTYNGTFKKDPSYFWFKTPPHLFLNTHYPEFFEDALVTTEMSREAFSALPLLIHPQLEHVQIEKPKDGILSSEESSGNFEFTINGLAVQEISFSFGKEIRPVEALHISEKTTSFTVPVALGAKQLLLYFDGAPALAYKID